ncbi:iron-containing redox enzyme family protein [Arthrobacter monumenti]
MKQPLARGPVSTALLDILGSASADDPRAGEQLQDPVLTALSGTPDIAFDDDLQLTLFCLYELHYSGIDGVDDAWEWAPGLIGARRRIEQAFEQKMRAAVELPQRPQTNSGDVAAALFKLTAPDGGGGMPRFAAKQASAGQLQEFLTHKSIYQLREADPHTWAIPRLRGRAKAALVEIQADEYGGGRPDRVHAELFAQAMRGAGLNPEFGGYVDDVPAITLATANLMSLFGLNRRLRGAIIGHLSAYEMTSSQPSRMYANGLRRAGFGDDVAEYFDEHVEADAVHEQIAGRDMAGGLVEAEPGLLDDVLFGAAAALAIETWLGEHIMAAWEEGRSSLQPQSSFAV